MNRAFPFQKPVLRSALLWLVVFSIHARAIAQPVIRHDARHSLHRTALILLEAQQVVKAGKIYTGNFSRAVAHQRFARKLFIDGKWLRSIHQSLRARRLAFLAIEANKGVVQAAWRADAIEKKYEQSIPADEELDKETPNLNDQQDEDLLNIQITDIDLGD